MGKQYLHSSNEITCPKCLKKYKVNIRDIHLPGAGSAADWEHLDLPCTHLSGIEYDSNRQRVGSIEEIK